MKTSRNRTRLLAILLCLSMLLGMVPVSADDGTEPVSKDALRAIVTAKVDGMIASLDPASGIDAIIAGINAQITTSVTNAVMAVLTPDALKGIAKPLISGAIKAAFGSYGIDLPPSVDVDGLVGDIMEQSFVDDILGSDIAQEIIAKTVAYAVEDIMDEIAMPTSAAIIAARRDELINQWTEAIFNAPMTAVDLLNINGPMVKSFIPVGTSVLTPNVNLSMYAFTISSWNTKKVGFGIFSTTVNTSVKEVKVIGWHTANVNTYIDLQSAGLSFGSVTPPDLSKIDYQAVVLKALERAAKEVIEAKVEAAKVRIRARLEAEIAKARSAAFDQINDLFEELGLPISLQPSDSEADMRAKMEAALRHLTEQQKNELLRRLQAMRDDVRVRLIPEVCSLLDRLMDHIRTLRPIVDFEQRVTLSSSLADPQIVTAPVTGTTDVVYTAQGEFRFAYMNLSVTPPVKEWTEWVKDDCKLPVLSSSLSIPGGSIPGVVWNATTGTVQVAAAAEAGNVTVIATYEPVGCEKDLVTSMQLEVKKKPVAPLQLTFMRGDSTPGDENAWRVRNTNPFAIDYSYEIYGAGVTGTGTVPAATEGGPGEVIFKTDAINRSDTMKIYWLNERNEKKSTVKASTGWAKLLVVSMAADGDVKNAANASVLGETFHWVDTALTLTAVSKAGLQFGYWSGSIRGDANPISFTIKSDMELYAEFNTTVVVRKFVVEGESSKAGAGFGFTIESVGREKDDARMSVSEGTLEKKKVLIRLTGTTNVEGLWTVSLPNGFYQLTEDESDDFTNSIPNGLLFEVFLGKVYVLPADDNVLDEETMREPQEANTLTVRNFPVAKPGPSPSPTPVTVTHPLSLTVVGSEFGSVNPGSGNYSDNSVVQFSVVPATGATFIGWSGADAGDVVSEQINGETRYKITMSKARTLVATFEKLTPIADQQNALAAPEVTEQPVVVAPVVPVPAEEPAVVVDTPVSVPLAAPELPKTGGLPVGLLASLGALITAGGFMMKRRGRKDEE